MRGRQTFCGCPHVRYGSPSDTYLILLNNFGHHKYEFLVTRLLRSSRANSYPHLKIVSWVNRDRFFHLWILGIYIPGVFFALPRWFWPMRVKQQISANQVEAPPLDATQASRFPKLMLKLDFALLPCRCEAYLLLELFFSVGDLF